MLRLLRGSGVAGLAAMRSWQMFTPGYLWRPLLAQPREALQQYAAKACLQWIEDPHNEDPRYTRSWLRKEILPRLRERFPQAEECLSRAANLAAEADSLLDELAKGDHAAARQGAALSIQALLNLHAARRRNLLRYWLRAGGFVAPAFEQLERLHEEVLLASSDAGPLMAWPGCEIRRYRDRLYAMRPLPPAPPAGTECSWEEPLLALPPGCGSLQFSGSWVPGLTVRFVRGGERFVPSRGGHRRTLKNLFQEAGVPTWVRERTPLVYLGDELVYIGGVGAGLIRQDLDLQRRVAWTGAPPGAMDAGGIA